MTDPVIDSRLSDEQISQLTGRGECFIHHHTDVPAQFNPIPGTNVTLSGTYPDITFNAAGGSGWTYLTPVDFAVTPGHAEFFPIPVSMTQMIVSFIDVQFNNASDIVSLRVSSGGGGSPNFITSGYGFSMSSIQDFTLPAVMYSNSTGEPAVARGISSPAKINGTVVMTRHYPNLNFWTWHSALFADGGVVHEGTCRIAQIPNLYDGTGLLLEQIDGVRVDASISTFTSGTVSVAYRSDEKTFLIVNQPGIRRDGTSIDSNQYNDGQWVRFQREAGRPKKMGGYRAIPVVLDGPCRGSYSWSRGGITEIMQFSDAEYMSQISIDASGAGAGTIRRNFGGIAVRPRDDYSWQVDSMYDSAVGSDKTLIFAHPGKNLINIDSDETSPVYYASVQVSGNSSLDVFESLPNGEAVSGGILCIAPYLVLYGSDGLVMWSNTNEPRNFVTGDAGTARITGSKIVRGLPLRGGSQSPAALLWSLDSVYRMYYIGGTQVFKFDPISSQSTVLSSNGIIEYDGKYFWAGVDRFLMYDGTVKEMVNNSNLNFFFDNLNFAQRQKVWVTKNTRYGEIWWHFPKGDSIECNHAVIYNVRLNCWYDTEINRSSGVASGVFPRPIWFENLADGTCKAWVHEEGHDRVDGESASAIPSYFETADFGFPTGGSDSEKPVGANRWTRITRVEPDFVMSGDMTVEVTGNEFAQVLAKESAPYTFGPDTGKIDLREQRREIRLRFTSNTLGGSYDAGKIIMHLDVGDVRS